MIFACPAEGAFVRCQDTCFVKYFVGITFFYLSQRLQEVEVFVVLDAGELTEAWGD